MNKFLSFAIVLLLAPMFLFAQPNPPQPNFFKQGMDHYNAGEYDAAIASFQKVVNMKPKPGGPNQQSAPQNPKKADALYYIGMCMLKKENPGGAIANFTKALEARPAYVQARLARGGAYIGAKDFDAAIADLTVVLEAQPGNEQANFLMGSANNWKANYPEAIRYYGKVLEINPNNAYAHYWIGLAYYKTKDLKQTIDHFEKFLELAPDAPEAPQVLEVLRQVQG